MRQGIIDVKAALGPAFEVSEKEIHDSLWHYYYDVDKTVAYLQSGNPQQTTQSTARLTYLAGLKAPKQPKPQKPKEVSRFDKSASSAAQRPTKGELFSSFDSYLLEDRKSRLPRVKSGNRSIDLAQHITCRSHYYYDL